MTPLAALTTLATLGLAATLLTRHARKQRETRDLQAWRWKARDW